MEFLQQFHTEYSNARKNGLVAKKWLIGAEAFAELKRMALEQEKILHNGSTILGVPYEVDATGSNRVELVTGGRKRLKPDLDTSSTSMTGTRRAPRAARGR